MLTCGAMHSEAKPTYTATLYLPDGSNLGPQVFPGNHRRASEGASHSASGGEILNLSVFRDELLSVARDGFVIEPSVEVER